MPPATPDTFVLPPAEAGSTGFLRSESPFGHEQEGESILLSRPLNTTTRRIFVAATRMNEGKTTSCLGLFSALLAHSGKVGYIKPIGQRFIEIAGHQIDEDSFLFDHVFHPTVPIQAMSPIAIDSTFTRRFLKHPSRLYPILVDKLSRAFDRAAFDKDYIIIEGSGHAGVGAVFDLSNAQSARVLGAKVIIVSSGGIGRPIDEIALNQALFARHGVEVIGAILNKVEPDKIDLVREFTTLGLARLGIPLLGILPHQPQLTAPNLSQIVEEISGRWFHGRALGESRRILHPIIGAMTARRIEPFLRPGYLVITPGDREDILRAAIAHAAEHPAATLSGLILTRDLLPDSPALQLLAQSRIPTVLSDSDAFTVASRINTMTVKTLPSDTDKIPLIKRLVAENIDLTQILAAFHPAS